MLPSLKRMGNVWVGAGGARCTPRAMPPMRAMTKMSFQKVDSQTRRGGEANGSTEGASPALGRPGLLGFSGIFCVSRPEEGTCLT